MYKIRYNVKSLWKFYLVCGVVRYKKIKNKKIKYIEYNRRSPLAQVTPGNPEIWQR